MASLDMNNAKHDALGLLDLRTDGPEVRLEAIEDGSFLYPPGSYAGVDSYLQFWLNVPISDEILGSVSAGYDEVIRQKSISEGVAWAHKYDYANGSALTHKDSSLRQQAEEAREEAHWEHMDDWHRENHPRVLPEYALRIIVRAGQISWYRNLLEPDVQDSVMDMHFLIRNTEMTIDKINRRYLLSELRASFRSPEVTAAERLEDLRIEIRRLSATA